MQAEWVPIVMFLMMGLVAGLFLYFRHRTRAELQNTVRVALEKGQELSPELLERLGEQKKKPGHDLRRGIIAIGLACGIASFGALVGDEDALSPMLAISMLPLFVGLAYLLIWGISGRKVAD